VAAIAPRGRRVTRRPGVPERKDAFRAPFPRRYTVAMYSAVAHARHLPAYEYRRVRWRNGLGWTREIHAAPADIADAWDWRLSIAEIEADGPYSAFPGIEREQVLLSGEGLELDFGADGRRLLLPPHGRQRFGGAAAVQARLQAGRVEVFNLMWQPARVAPRLWHRPLVGSMLLFVDPGTTWALHVMAGQATLGGDDMLPLLEMGDSALLTANDQRTRHVVEGAGELLLVCVEPVDDQYTSRR
jgi:environmental stress-induced protein Ves